MFNLTKKSWLEHPEIKESATGLKWVDLKVGEGKTAKHGDTVEVHYTGWHSDQGKPGKKFDSSHDRKQPFAFGLGLGSVIKGWDEGVQAMREGGKRVLIIPYTLAYGSQEIPGVIPARSDLIFEVELLSVS